MFEEMSLVSQRFGVGFHSGTEEAYLLKSQLGLLSQR